MYVIFSDLLMCSNVNVVYEFLFLWYFLPRLFWYFIFCFLSFRYMISKICFFSWQKKNLKYNHVSPFNQCKFILLRVVRILLWFTVVACTSLVSWWIGCLALFLFISTVIPDSSVQIQNYATYYFPKMTIFKNLTSTDMQM